MSQRVIPSERILMGPGPSNVDPRVLRALAAPVMGHLDPDFLAIMEDTMGLLRMVFGTKNQLTMPMSGTGSAGMETVLVNFVEPGDRVVVAVCGLFGERMVDILERVGAEVSRVEAPWGRAVDPEDIRRVAKERAPVKAICVVHAETSTGVRQDLEPVAAVAREVDALLIVDCVTSLGGMPVNVDEVGVDVAYSGSQKCLSCPPGLAPVTANDRALELLDRRRGKVPSWYLDLTMIRRYWGQERFYHHTAPVNMIYALREAVYLIVQEGLQNVYQRHARNMAALVAGLEALGVGDFLPPEGQRLASLAVIKVPEGVDELAVRRFLLREFSLEIAGGLGPLKGKVWRIGLMGYNSKPRNVILLLSALAAALRQQGVKVDLEASLAAALKVLSS